MSDLIPPLVSSTPPPILDDDDDEFDDFVAHNNYICDFPTQVEETKNKTIVDINSNKNGMVKTNLEVTTLPNEVPIMSKREDVPSDIIASSEKIVGINDYREEPPEICSDEDDFGDFEYSNAKTCNDVDNDVGVIKMEDPELKDFTSISGEITQNGLVNDIYLNSFESQFKNCDLSKEIQENDLKFNPINSDENCTKLPDLKIDDSITSDERKQRPSKDLFEFFQNDSTNNENFTIIDECTDLDSNFVSHNSSFNVNSQDILKFDESCTVTKSLSDVEVNLTDFKDTNVLKFDDFIKSDENRLVNHVNFELGSENNQVFNENDLKLSINYENIESDNNMKSNLDNCDIKSYQKMNENLFTLDEIVDDSILSVSFESSNEMKNTITNSQEITSSIENKNSLEVISNHIIAESPENFMKNFVNPEENFFDFKTCPETISATIIKTDLKSEAGMSSDTIIDDFEDFADFKSNSFNNPTVTGDDDDFGDFVGPEEQKCNAFEKVNESLSETLILNEENAYEKSKIIIEDMFKATDITSEPYFGHNFIDNNSIFSEIKDVTETNALTYLWSKSNTQKTLLNALHIDSRNVLYGGGINACMPKFASNLSSAPLEPIKSDVSLTSASSSQQSTSTKEIPSVVFDWKESGLANPLDSPQNGTVLLDLEQLVTSLQNSPEVTETHPAVSLDEWENWLQTIHKEDSPEQSTIEPNPSSPEENVPTNNNPIPIMSSDNISVKSLQLNTTAFDEENTAKDYFEPLGLENREEMKIFNQIPNTEHTVNIKLRETHIHETHIPETTTDDDEFTEFQTSTKIEDDFSDFISCNDTNSQPDISKRYFDNNFKAVNEDPGFNTNKTTLEKAEINLKPSIDTQINLNSTINSELRESSMPVFHNGPIKNNLSQSVSFEHSSVETKQLTLLTPTPITPTTTEQTEINWPDPGITDDELERLENYSRLNKKENNLNEINKLPTMQEKRLTFSEKSIVVSANKVVLPSKEVMLPPNDKVVISKDLVLPILESSPRKFNTNKRQDDDEWTDFISSNTERISTPELPLSIPQLKQIQPPKLPIPVITPMGLKQTKIPSSMPILQPKVSHIPLQPKPPLDGYQPSIISHQYSLQMNQNVFLQNNFQTTTIPANIAHVSNGFNHEDEEWSDFMCSQPVNITPQNKQSLPHVQKPIPSISSMPDLNFASSNKYRHFNK